MTGRIDYSPRAERQLDDLDEWISEASNSETAQRFVTAIIAHIDRLLILPQSGRQRDDVRPGMRTTTYKKRTLIAYFVEASGEDIVVKIAGIFHGGQDWETALRDDEDAEQQP